MVLLRLVQTNDQRLFSRPLCTQYRVLYGTLYPVSCRILSYAASCILCTCCSCVSVFSTYQQVFNSSIAASLRVLSTITITRSQYETSNIKHQTEIKQQHQQYQHSNHQICLLYTSPSPRDRQKSRMPSSA